jgi:hypothetical protein
MRESHMETNNLEGTGQYAAPEIATTVTPAVDVYSFGIMYFT